MKNKQLEKDVTTGRNSFDGIPRHRVIQIYPGSVSGASIEVELENPISFTSYPYYDRVDDRDSDYIELKEILHK